MLIIASKTSEFEAGINRNCQTTASNFGIKQLMVVVNKVDILQAKISARHILPSATDRSAVTEKNPSPAHVWQPGPQTNLKLLLLLPSPSTPSHSNRPHPRP